MMDTPSRTLQDLRGVLRTETLGIEELIAHVSTCLDALFSSSGPSVQSIYSAIQRYLPSLQVQLLSQTIPHYLHALDGAQKDTLRALFAPSRQRTDPKGLYISRGIALVSYLTLPGFLNAAPVTSLPIPSRLFLLEVLERLGDYEINDLYWAVWSEMGEEKGREGNRDTRQGGRELLWEEATRSAVAIPGKSTNAAGRWKSEGWTGDLPDRLSPKLYFDRMIPRLEQLTYEISLSSSSRGGPDRIRLVIERFASLGILNTTTTSQSSRQPSFFPSFLPGLLAHLHPDPSSPLSPYPPNFLPSIFLPLPASTLATFATSLLRHLSSRLPAGCLKPDAPDQGIHRATRVFGQIVGPAKVREEAWEAVMRTIPGQKTLSDPMDNHEHIKARIIAGWVNSAGIDEKRAFLELVNRAWTDPKSIKFALFSQQFHLTHMLLLALSLFRQYDPYIVSLSHRPEFLMAIQSFLSHPDPKLRRLGMLVAEILSERTIKEDSSINGHMPTEEEEMAELQAGFEAQEGSEGSSKPPRTAKGPKRLKFDSGMWDGAGEGREECRWLRSCMGVNDLEASIGDDPTDEGWMLGWDQVTVEESSTPPRQMPPRGREPATEKTRSRAEGKTPSKPKPKAKPKIVMLDEAQQADPLEGYAPSSPSSSRSPSPTPSYLEEVAADPTLALDATQNRKVSRPVYVPQLIVLLKEREKPDHIEMGLKWGEGLVRAKRSFGTELAENAVNVALVTLALNDPYHLDKFEEQRQGLLNALVACAPRQVAPILAEQYFNGQYSLQQKSVLLTSLAMGARELAGLAVPQPISTNRRIDFPTKVLPAALHSKYIGPNDLAPSSTNTSGNQLEEAIGGVRDLMLSKSARKGEETIPELAREKKLRVGPGRTTKVAEMGSLAERHMPSTAVGSDGRVTQVPVVPFKDVAAEYFIMPLINRFWLHFQDSSTREARAMATGDRYRGAGTGMILSPLALEKLLMTLSLLLHASRHSSLFLSVLAPEVMEMGITVGSRHSPSPSNNPLITDLDTAGLDDGSNTEAQVLAAALEMVLVALDISVELDGGRTLAMDKAELALAAGEWASGVFEVERKGGQVSAGQGGMREGRVRATAAGVVVKIAEIGEKFATVGGRMR